MPRANTIANPAPAGRIHVLEVLGNAITGGMETHVAQFIQRLPHDRFTVTVLSPFESAYTRRLRELDIEVLVTPMPIDSALWCSIQTICTLARTAAVDVLHAHLPNAHLLAGVAGSIVGKPVVATIHGRQLTPLDLEVHRTTHSHIAVVCKQSYFHALGVGVSAAHLTCIPNGVDTEVFSPREDDRLSSVRTALGLAADVPLIGFVGRLHWEKGPDVFANAALLASGRLPHAHFAMFGEGPMNDTLEAFIDRTGMSSRLHLAGLQVDMPTVYRELDLVVSSSYSEAMPLAVMEAMASGLPVIGTCVGGVTELIEQDGTGRLVNAGDHAAIAHEIVDLLSSPTLLKEMGRRARARAIERFALGESVGRMEHLLTELVSGHGESRHLGTVRRDLARPTT